MKSKDLHLLSGAARTTSILFTFHSLPSKFHSLQHPVINSGDILSENQSHMTLTEPQMQEIHLRFKK